MRVAAVDIGTNSTRLLIWDLGTKGADDPVDLERIDQVTGLGRGADDCGRLAPDSIERTVRVLAHYGRLIERTRPVAARAVATAATRDAPNREEFLDAAQQALGFRPEVISGTEEAALAFQGATFRRADLDQIVVIDIGGGSTEIVTKSGGVSVNLGSVRVTEGFLPDHPARSGQVSAARRAVEETLGPAGPFPNHLGLGTAGTWTSLASLHLYLSGEPWSVVEGTRLGSDDLDRIVSRLATLTLPEKRSLPALNKKRAPIILGGAIIAEAALLTLGLGEITVTGADILDGVCLELATDLEYVQPTTQETP
ncbi:MAG: exopolyphosphatase [Acidimicrobiia bacterium]|nr:exopolyphosphatase [Acidimicrobiia bacterium]